MIRFATVQDIDRIMAFIDTYWRKHHIMSRDRRLFEFQHLWGNEVSFVLSEDDGQINGVLGYIPYDRENRDITLAIWKTIKSKDTMLGVHILQFLRENGRVCSINAPGINVKTRPIYEFLGYHTGKMKHWYRLNHEVKQTIAVIRENLVACMPGITTKISAGKSPVHDKTLKVEYLSTYDDAVKFGLSKCQERPHQLYKSLEFVERRYYNHPSYQYQVYGLSSGTKKLVIIFRVQPCNESFVLRLIDCIGDHELIQYSMQFMDRLIREKSCEYVDCYEIGVDDKYFKNAGWMNVSDTSNIIPEYFSPFEQRNVNIYYMSEFEDTILFKGDGDMDRPN